MLDGYSPRTFFASFLKQCSLPWRCRTNAPRCAATQMKNVCLKIPKRAEELEGSVTHSLLCTRMPCTRGQGIPKWVSWFNLSPQRFLRDLEVSDRKCSDTLHVCTSWSGIAGPRLEHLHSCLVALYASVVSTCAFPPNKPKGRLELKTFTLNYILLGQKGQRKLVLSQGNTCSVTHHK